MTHLPFAARERLMAILIRWGDHGTARRVGVPLLTMVRAVHGYALDPQAVADLAAKLAARPVEIPGPRHTATSAVCAGPREAWRSLPPAYRAPRFLES